MKKASYFARRMAIALTMALTTLCWASPVVLLEDSFSDNMLNATLWRTNTLNSASDVSEINQRIQITNRGWLYTADQFPPGAAGELHIQGTWTLNDYRDMVDVMLRSDAVHNGTFNGIPRNGVACTLDPKNDRMYVVVYVDAVGTLLTNVLCVANAGETFRFDIYDDGQSVHYRVTEIGGDGTTVDVVVPCTTGFALNHAVFFNRENQEGPHTAFLDNVRIERTPPPPVITGFEDGQLTWTHAPGTNAFRIEWAPELTAGHWYSNWWGRSYLVTTGSQTTVAVPQFYRVVHLQDTFDNADFAGPWILEADDPIFLIADGNGGLTAGGMFGMDDPPGSYGVNADGSLAIRLATMTDPDLFIVGRFLGSNTIPVQPSFPGERLLRVTNAAAAAGAWTGSLTETSPGSTVYPLTLGIGSDGAVTNGSGFPPPMTGHCFGLGNPGAAVGFLWTGEPSSNPYNQIWLSGVLSNSTLKGVYAADGEDVEGVFELTR